MTWDRTGQRRRDVLRIGAGAALVGVAGLTTTGASTNRRLASSQTQRPQNVFSFSLQDDDQFRVRFRPRDQEGNPATVTIPADCFEDGSEPREYEILIVRAYRDQIELGFRGLFVSGEADGTTTVETTPAEEETTPAEEETTPAEETTPTDEETIPEEDETPTEETPTEAAIQEETTTPEETTPEETTPEETPEAETTPEETPTPSEEPPLPEIRIGEWYRVASSTQCANLTRLTLESIAEPETTPGGPETEPAQPQETTPAETETGIETETGTETTTEDGTTPEETPTET